MPETIEAEVIEIDGIVPPKHSETEADAGSSSGRAARSMRGAGFNLDRRWWPLWVLLGVLAVILLLTVGVVFGACYLIFSLIRGVLRVLFGGLAGGGADAGALRRG